MSDTTSDTAAIDEKKESTTVTGNYVTNVKNFTSTVVSNAFFFIIYFSLSSLLLFGCKLTQSNILPTETKCYPYTATKPIIKQNDINIFTSTIVHDNGTKEKMSLKMKFPYDDYNSSNKLLDMTREYKNEPRSNFLANYFISILESLVQFNYSSYTAILNMLNGLPESIILLFGPMIFGIITFIIILFNNLYLIYLWFSNMGWFFKTNANDSTSGSPKWKDVTWFNPIDYCISIWMVIIFGFGFLFTMPVYFFLAFLLLYWLIISSLTFKAQMNGNPYSMGTFIKDSFKYNKNLIIFLYSLFVISAAFSQLGTTSGVFSIIVLILIYFDKIHINLFGPVSKDGMTAVSVMGFEQATKTCKKATSLPDTALGVAKHVLKGVRNIASKASLGVAALGAAKYMSKGGSNIKKDLLKLNKKLDN